MVSDVSYEELHAFAARLGLPPRAFERDHYDVPSELYETAVALGAAPVGCQELLRRLTFEAKLTLVIVTHEMGFAAKLADRALVLHEGDVIEDGPPAEVLARPRDPRTRAFLGLDA